MARVDDYGATRGGGAGARALTPSSCWRRWCSTTSASPGSRSTRRRCSRSSSPRSAPEARPRPPARRCLHEQGLGAVIRREFVERVRTRAFIIGTVLGPVFFGALVILPGLLAEPAEHRASGSRWSMRRHRSARRADRDRAGAGRRSGVGSERPGAYTCRPVPAGRPGGAGGAWIRWLRSSGFTKDGPDGAGRDARSSTESALAHAGRSTYYGTNVGSLEDMRRLRGHAHAGDASPTGCTGAGWIRRWR